MSRHDWKKCSLGPCFTVKLGFAFKGKHFVSSGEYIGHSVKFVNQNFELSPVEALKTGSADPSFHNFA